MLSIEHLCVNYGEKRILKDISLSITDGEIVLMVGESGSGKSTLVRSIMGLLGKGGTLCSGDIVFEGQSLKGLKERDYRRIRGQRIAMVFQQPERSLDPTMTIGRQFYEAMAVHRGISREEADQRAVSLLERLGFEETQPLLAKYPFELSGGMCQRAAIALSVANEPKLLLADEPTSALDVVVQKQTLDMLRQMREKMHMAMLVVTHNMGVVSYMADKVGVMHRGHLVEWGTRDEILHDPQHDYTQALIRAIPTMDGQLPLYESVRHSKPKRNVTWYTDTHWALTE